MSDSSERRRHHRFMALLEIRVLPGDKVPADLKLTTIDIGAGGARCYSNRPMEAAVRVQVTVTLVGGGAAGPTPIDVDAVVQRCDERPRAPEPRRYELALEFVRVDSQDRKKLLAFLNSL